MVGEATLPGGVGVLHIVFNPIFLSKGNFLLFLLGGVFKFFSSVLFLAGDIASPPPRVLVSWTSCTVLLVVLVLIQPQLNPTSTQLGFYFPYGLLSSSLWGFPHPPNLVALAVHLFCNQIRNKDLLNAS